MITCDTTQTYPNSANNNLIKQLLVCNRNSEALLGCHPSLIVAIDRTKDNWVRNIAQNRCSCDRLAIEAKVWGEGRVLCWALASQSPEHWMRSESCTEGKCWRTVGANLLLSSLWLSLTLIECSTDWLNGCDDWALRGTERDRERPAIDWLQNQSSIANRNRPQTTTTTVIVAEVSPDLEVCLRQCDVGHQQQQPAQHQ